MSKRPYGIAVAQLGPIQPQDTRAQCVARLLEMMREAASRGAKLVVFPELALTTFFPRYWMTEQEAEQRYFEASMPGPETAVLFETARIWPQAGHFGAKLASPSKRERAPQRGHKPKRAAGTSPGCPSDCLVGKSGISASDNPSRPRHRRR